MTAHVRSRPWLSAATGGAPALPLVVLFLVNFVDEFDRVAFGVLSPEIRDTFDLSDGGIVAIGAVAGLTSLLAALPIGILADRLHRVRLAAVGAGVWGAFTVVTALSPATWVLALSRTVAGIGHIVNEPVHASLLSDYYKPVQHPRVFALHRLANPVGLSSALLIGVLGAAFDWRLVFAFLCVPTFLLLPALLRLREPVRGESVDPGATPLRAVPVGEARHQLFRIRTLRRLWVALPILGTATLVLTQLSSLFFEREYGYGPTGRGVVTFLSGVGIVVGLGLGQRVATRALADGCPERLATFNGLGAICMGAGIAGMVLSPWPLLSAALNLVTGIGVGAYQPSYFSLVALVSPARVRSQAYAYAILFLGLGAFLAPAFGSIGESAGYRLSLGVLAASIVVAGLVITTAARTVRADAAHAVAELEAAAAAELGVDPAAPMLSCRGVEVAYGSVQILFGIDLEVQRGEIVALLGTNGAGKSTLLKAVSGLVTPMAGTITLDGRDISRAGPVAIAKLGVVQVPGGKATFPTLTVAEHFTVGAWLMARDDRRQVQERIDTVLDRFPRLRERWDQLGGDLSGGEQQQLALAMAFVARPTLLVIDELSLGLAPSIVGQLLEMVRDIHAQGCTIIIVEQSVNVALTLADRAYFLEKGEVRFSGPTAELLERTDILRSVFLKGSAASQAVVREPAPEAPPGAAVPVLEVRGLAKSFGGIRAVDRASFTVHEGEVLGLIGPNGAGKTTIFDLVSGLVPLDEGQLVLGGVDVTAWSAHRRAAAGLGRSFQDAKIFPGLTVAENIAVALERHLEHRDHLAAAIAMPAIAAMEEDIAFTVQDLVEMLNLGAFRETFVSELSTGTRRIVDLAMSLAHDPKVLLLDEPSSGVAQRETEALGPLLLRIRDETRCALLVIEHDMPLMTSICDEIVALELGAVVTQGRPDDVLADPRVVSAYLGGDVAAINRSGTAPAPRRRRAGVMA